MLPSRFLLHGICLLVLVSIVDAVCTEATPLVYWAVKEEYMDIYDVLFTFNGSANGITKFYALPINGTFTLKFWEIFRVLRQGVINRLVIWDPTALRTLREKYGTTICGLGIEIYLGCFDNPQSTIGVAYTRYLYIRPYLPEFKLNYIVSWFDLPEDANHATWYEDMWDVVNTPRSMISKFRFQSNRYNVTHGWYDARTVLYLLPNGTVRLYQDTYLDSEEWSPRMTYYLNFTLFAKLFVCKGQSTIGESPWHSTTEIMTFSLSNVNDSPPRFVRGGCPPLCGPPNYKAWVSRTFTGNITNVEDGPIAAHDPDGDLNLFSLSGGTPISYSIFFAITRYYGIVSVTHPLGNIKTNLFNLTIKVQSFTQLRNHARFIPNDKVYTSLLVYVTPSIKLSQLSTLPISSSFSSQPCITGIIVMTVVVFLM